MTLLKVSYVIVKLQNSSHLLKVCLNNANRPKIIMAIKIKIKQIRILKRTLYVTGQIFLHNETVMLNTMLNSPKSCITVLPSYCFITLAKNDLENIRVSVCEILGMFVNTLTAGGKYCS